MNNSQVIKRYRARFGLVGRRFVEDCVVEVAGGRIVSIGSRSKHSTIEGAQQGDDEPIVDLGNVAIIPGFINTHSHAFQRAIRGRTEFIDPERPEDDFWTWRSRMYQAATTSGPEEIEAVAALAFLEMALSGISAVGEFHYLHHQPDGTPYDDPDELAHRVIAAAEAVGIRIALLRVAYARGGYEKPLVPEQRRFVEADVETYLERVDGLSHCYSRSPKVTVGLAPHSVRAVPSSWLEAIHGYAMERELPVHIHACEQRAELKECRAEYGKTPIELLATLGMLDERLTIVHGTHLSPKDLVLMAGARPTVCACPTTERNLGDGFLPAFELVKGKIPIALGSDSHTVIDLFEEMRLVEYHERLRFERRNVLATEALSHRLVSAEDASWPTARMLFPMGTAHGARSLRLPAGILEPGTFADFTTIDLDHISLIGATAETLLTDVVLTMPPGAVDGLVPGERLGFVRVGRRQLERAELVDELFVQFKALARGDDDRHGGS